MTFIQVVHLENHWVCLTNYNPWLDESNPIGTWHMYDSIQQPETYLPKIGEVMKRFTDGVRCHVNYPTLRKQFGYADCGLFALGYATALCMDIDPTTLIFDQFEIRKEFNRMIETSQIDLFPHFLTKSTQMNSSIHYF